MKSIFSALLLLCSVIVFSQQPSLNTDYLKKSKRQKTAAFILLGGGLLSTAIGSVQFNNGDGTGGNSRNTVFTVTGIIAIGSSIPLFIAAGKNRKRATSVGFKMEKLRSMHQQNFVYHSYPALSLQIALQ